MKKQILGILLTGCLVAIQPTKAGVVFEAQASIYTGDFITNGGMAVGGNVDKIDWATYTKDWGWSDLGHIWRVRSSEPMIFTYYYDGEFKDVTLYIYNRDIHSGDPDKTGLSSLDLKINGKPVTLSQEIADGFGIGGDQDDVTKYIKKGFNIIEVKSGNPKMKHLIQKVLIQYYD